VVFQGECQNKTFNIHDHRHIPFIALKSLLLIRGVTLYINHLINLDLILKGFDEYVPALFCLCST
jgi:hypothetical protein